MGMLLRRHYPPKKTAEVEKTKETDSLSDLNVKELKELAKQRGIKGYNTLTKQELLEVLNG
ncbi:Rho termination factor, N-terminal domain [Streptococcus gallolyticus]|uniref:Rho termination factor, N-terminal domain n=1 Tax=Streptococcus gallolyticus TaxID=315405 RepID=A0A1H7XSE4_9STRE|nr:Rho termination factor N-terminal domain-containing protein [Streptococcus gallolyticus]SEF25495.1 Rho termination factor, N-terminal domain [Streptococcus gallolyticus]SEM36563.1 Rho termination factor, N-terminal domain [Streptococcus gallolyticus]